MNDIKQSIVYWIGYVEEANRHIDILASKQGETAKLQFRMAKRKRDEGLKKIAELGGSADLLRTLFGLQQDEKQEPPR